MADNQKDEQGKASVSEAISNCPNPKCGKECRVYKDKNEIPFVDEPDTWHVYCINSCGYSGPTAESEAEAIGLHNAIAGKFDIYHARWDGNGEPFFVLRAQDKHAPWSVSSYIGALENARNKANGLLRKGQLSAVIKSAIGVRDAMRKWPHTKSPDMVPTTKQPNSTEAHS